MLTSVVVRVIARSSNSIVSFFTALDARLDVFLAKHDAEVLAFENEVAGIKAKAQTEALRIAREAKEEVEEIEAKIAAKSDAAAVLLGIKNSLPTNTSR